MEKNYTEQDLKSFFEQILTAQGMSDELKKSKVEEMMESFVGFYRDKYPQGLQTAINNTIKNFEKQMETLAATGVSIHSH